MASTTVDILHLKHLWNGKALMLIRHPHWVLRCFPTAGSLPLAKSSRFSPYDSHFLCSRRPYSAEEWYSICHDQRYILPPTHVLAHHAFHTQGACTGLMKRSLKMLLMSMLYVRAILWHVLCAAAMNQLTKNLCCEWGPDGIRVNAVSPWYTLTPLAQQVLQDKEYEAKVLSRTPLKRVAQPDEVSGAQLILRLDHIVQHLKDQDLE